MFVTKDKQNPSASEIQKLIDQLKTDKIIKTEAEATRLAQKYALVGQVKPAGRLSVSPWSEDRGPNPYLLVTGQAGTPWVTTSIWDWFIRDQVPVMIEPLIKFVRPIVYFLSPRNDFWSRVYFLLVTLWTLVTWSFFGGAITHIAAVQIARNESVGLVEAVRFTSKRFFSYLFAPLFPLAFVFIVLVLLCIFGLLHTIPVLGDIVIDGLLWPLTLIAGLGMALALVCLPSWPLMAATVSAEGSDSWEAVSRAYSYIINRPWQCLWYGLVAVAYGGVIVFFVGFMSSLAVYLAKWGVGHTPAVIASSREPSFLFVYAPTSFGWRDLLLEGAQVRAPEEMQDKDKELKLHQGDELVASRASQSVSLTSIGGISRWNRINPDAYTNYLKTMSWWNTMGAVMVAFWLGLMFLGVLGFGYAYFWSASTIIYMLLRRDMDAAEMDEVYFEEDEYDGTRVPPAVPATATPPAAAPTRPVAQSLPIVEAPRPAPVVAPTPPTATAAIPPTPTITSVPSPAPPPPAPTPMPEKPPEVLSTPVPEKPPEHPPEAIAPSPPPEPPKDDPGSGMPPVV